jgi:arsenite methyltransferase
VQVLHREPLGIDDCELYLPLFTPELIDLMRRLIPVEKQGEVATTIVLKARLTTDRQ